MTSGRADLQRRMAIWYLREYHPDITTFKYQYPIFDERLLEKADQLTYSDSFFTRAMPRIDLLVELENHTEIIELKAAPRMKDLAELKFYENAFKHDRTQKSRKRKRIALIFVTVDDHQSLEIYAKNFGIKYIYVPLHRLPPPEFIYLGKL